MTVLVTGSAGHLGEAMMRTLRRAGQDARGLDVKPSPFTDHVGSIGDRSVVRAAMAGVTGVVHAATLHKPHVASHTNQDFIDVNLTGTLALLEEAAARSVRAFVLTSTTSAFGAAMTPDEGSPAAWVTEELQPVPKNIYGATKVAAESLCELFARTRGLPAIVLRTSRFFPEADDDPEIFGRYDQENVRVNELLNRRVDIEDVVSAHMAALERAPSLRFGRYIVSATSPFGMSDLAELRRDAPAVVARLFPDQAGLYAARGWRMFPAIDRVYVNDLARRELGWTPRYDFAHALDALRQGRSPSSELAAEVGSKGYHDARYTGAAYRAV